VLTLNLELFVTVAHEPTAHPKYEKWDDMGRAAPAASIADQEPNLLLNILKECGWNKKLAAQRLGISRSTVYAILKRYKISKPTTH